VSSVEEDITAGLLQCNDPQHHCLAYQRKLSTATAGPSKNVVGSNHVEELWQKVQQCLGSEHSREYTITSAPRRCEMTAEQETYLQKLSDDFVCDMKALITQNLAEIQIDPSTKQLVQDIQHHTMLAKELLRTRTEERECENYSELFQRLQSYITDPGHSRPFVIYGSADSDKSRLMSAVAGEIHNWLSTSGLVIVLRFLGSTTDSVDFQTCLASVRAQIQMAYGMEVLPACESLHSELTAFCDVLEQISQTSGHTEPLVILLDGVEQLRPHQRTLEALWAVHHLPSNVHLIMSVTVSGEQTDIIAAFLTLITSSALKYQLSSTTEDHLKQTHPSTGALPCRLLSSVQALMSTLNTMEADYGPMLVKYFAAYVTVMDVGIVDSELLDLLVTNDEVMSERDGVLFSPGLVAILRHKLVDFLASRLVHGRLGFAWSKPEYQQAVAERYQVTVGENGLEAQSSERSTEFTLTLHQHVLHIYHDVTQNSSDRDPNTSLEEDLDKEHGVRTTVQTLGPHNAIKANRVLHHLRILLPVNGLNQLKSCVLFNLEWLMTRLATSPLSHVINDVMVVYNLCRDMHQHTITTDSVKDIAVLLEFLQLSSKALSVNFLSLPVEITSRLGSSSFVEKYSSVAELVSQSRRWLANTDCKVVVPLWSVWDHPGGMRRHILDGLSYVVGLVDGGDAVIGYCRHRVSIWSVESGSMLQSFEVKSEQPVGGVIAAHHGSFIITSCCSPITRMTQVNVLSTETGLTLLSANFHHRLEAVALSTDDQLFVMSSVSWTDTESGSQLMRSILGINIVDRDVVFQLPLVNIHSEGISNHVASFVYDVYHVCTLVIPVASI